MAVINAASFVLSLPLATRCLSALVVLLSASLFLLRLFRTEEPLHYFTFTRNDSAIAFPWLVIVPGVSFWYPWTLVTTAFCETTFIEFLITIVSLPLAGRYFERIWGPIELVRFSLIVIVASNIISWFISIVLFVVIRSETAFYGTQWHGMEALQVAFLVAFAQLMPDHQVQLLGGKLPSLRVRDLPMAYVTFSNVMCLVGLPSPFILIQFGWLVSWVYLRFYRYNPESGTRGDRSETFSLVLWFPPFLHKPVGMLSSFLHPIFVRLKLIPQFHYEYVAGDLEFGSTVGPDMTTRDISGGADAGGPVSARAEAERRRAMALKALDQRMAAGAAQSNSNATTSAAPAPAPAAAGQPAAPAPTEAGASSAPSSSGSKPDVVPHPSSDPTVARRDDLSAMPTELSAVPAMPPTTDATAAAPAPASTSGSIRQLAYRHLLPPTYTQTIAEWLAEDCPSFDYGGFVVGEEVKQATLWCKSPGVLAGVPFFDEVFRQLGCTVQWYFDEGASIGEEAAAAGGKVKVKAATVIGPARKLLLGERVALNTLARCSGIATASSLFLRAARTGGFKGIVAGTRKTTPGFRLVEKYGMLIGGIDTHRYDLSSMIMLKDNHIWSTGSIPAAVAAARAAGGFALRIDVEVQSEAEARQAIDAGADVIMLDNLEGDELVDVARRLKRDLHAEWATGDAQAQGSKPRKNFLLESSGGIDITNVAEGKHLDDAIDVISTSAVHQSTKHVDFSLKIEP